MLAFVASACASRPSRASPTVPLDDPRYDDIPAARLTGLLPLTESRLRRLTYQPDLPGGTWLRLDRAVVGAFFDRDRLRPYSTSIRPRDIAGGIAVTCEHTGGEPCIGSGVLGEVDGSAGYGSLVSGTVRLRANAGSQGYDPTLAIDRAYVLAEYGPIAVEAGRDVLVVGPRSRTQLGWGDNAPALDHVRLSTSQPFALTRDLDAEALWAVGRLRAPQTFPGTIVSISRVQLDIARNTVVGAQQQIEMGGDGAPAIGGPIDFLLEHVRRRDISAGATDSSNRRFGGDVSFTIPSLDRTRFYYAIMFEDIRKARWIDAIRYDADHLFGVEFHHVTMEYHQTGVRSQEHSARTTGFTNAGRAVGSALGPDARSWFVGTHFHTEPHITIYPWFEIASVGRDIYQFVEYGPIDRIASGAHEERFRIGNKVRRPLLRNFALEIEGIAELVGNYAYTNTLRANFRLGVQLVYRAQ